VTKKKGEGVGITRGRILFFIDFQEGKGTRGKKKGGEDALLFSSFISTQRRERSRKEEGERVAFLLHSILSIFFTWGNGKARKKKKRGRGRG